MSVVLQTTIMLVDLFIVITRVSVAIMQVVFSAVHCNYASDCFCCTYVCVVAMSVTFYSFL